MSDGGSISVGCLVAAGLWCIAVAFLAVGWVLDDWHLMATGLGVCAAAATATVRVFFVKQNEIMRNSLRLMSERDRVYAVR